MPSSDRSHVFDVGLFVVDGCKVFQSLQRVITLTGQDDNEIIRKIVEPAKEDIKNGKFPFFAVLRAVAIVNMAEMTVVLPVDACGCELH